MPSPQEQSKHIRYTRFASGVYSLQMAPPPEGLLEVAVYRTDLKSLVDLKDMWAGLRTGSPMFALRHSLQRVDLYDSFGIPIDTCDYRPLLMPELPSPHPSTRDGILGEAERLIIGEEPTSSDDYLVPLAFFEGHGGSSAADRANFCHCFEQLIASEKSSDEVRRNLYVVQSHAFSHQLHAILLHMKQAPMSLVDFYLDHRSRLIESIPISQSSWKRELTRWVEAHHHRDWVAASLAPRLCPRLGPKGHDDPEAADSQLAEMMLSLKGNTRLFDALTSLAVQQLINSFPGDYDCRWSTADALTALSDEQFLRKAESVYRTMGTPSSKI